VQACYSHKNRHIQTVNDLTFVQTIHQIGYWYQRRLLCVDILMTCGYLKPTSQFMVVSCWYAGMAPHNTFFRTCVSVFVMTACMFLAHATHCLYFIYLRENSLCGFVQINTKQYQWLITINQLTRRVQTERLILLINETGVKVTAYCFHLLSLIWLSLLHLQSTAPTLVGLPA